MEVYKGKKHIDGEYDYVLFKEKLLDMYTSVVAEITKGENLPAILEQITRKLKTIFNSEMFCSILLTDGGRKLILNDTTSGLELLKEGLQSALAEKRNADQSSTFIYSKIETERSFDAIRDQLYRLGICAYWSTPISSAGKIIGCLTIFHSNLKNPTTFEKQAMKDSASLLALSINQVKRNEFLVQVKESEERFRSFLEYNPIPTFVFSRDGKVIDYNKVIKPISGYEREEIVGKDIISFVQPKDFDKVKYHFNEANKGKIQKFECVAKQKDGGELNLNVTFLPYTINGNVERIYGFARESTYEKQLELQLLDTYKEIEQLFINHEGMIFKFKKKNDQFIHTFGDGQLLRKLGLRKEDCIGKSLYEFLPAETAAQKVVFYEQAWNGREITYEGEINDVRYVASLKPLLKEGKVVEVIVTCNDISELEKVHEDLRTTKELLESFIENTVDAIATIDLEDNITTVNQAYVEMFGWQEKELIGKKTQVIPDEYKDEYFHFTNMALAGKKVQIEETIRRKKDGTSFSVSITKSPIKDKNGVVIGAASIIRDITAQKRIEQQLEENKQRYQSLFYANPDLVYSLDINGVFLNVNPVVDKIIGYAPEELVGKKYDLWVDKKSLKNTKLYFKKALKGVSQTYETIVNHKNGHKVTLKVTNVPIVINEAIVGVFGISKDITKRKRTEEYIRKTERLTAIGKLAAGIAHEIRNPLTSVKGFLQFMREQSNDKSYFDLMLVEIDRIELITNEFLILAKPQVKNYNYKSVDSILYSFLPLIETQAILNNVQIVTEIEKHLPNIYCDVNQIKQVFLNIIKNSIESMSNGGEIKITVKKSHEYILISIKDQGCGIQPDRLRTIGEPFYSTKEKGTGLGLMVSFNIIKEHHGDIHIQSELEKGTQVNILLPYSEQTVRDFLTIDSDLDIG
ncbi:PAS domain S-box protein [Alkalihalobacterium alkalinitrilicum]|uniref:PAS domain S-box protein n=1 Tax=Alkalihalobacterium alkalinitrilicum TaxID=427920 RepID=UPI0009953CD9|nr:PAS domain S-box protein [Alkalihalobacterium alkalinitrilicum]